MNTVYTGLLECDKEYMPTCMRPTSLRHGDKLAYDLIRCTFEIFGGNTHEVFGWSTSQGVIEQISAPTMSKECFGAVATLVACLHGLNAEPVEEIQECNDTHYYVCEFTNPTAFPLV